MNNDISLLQLASRQPDKTLIQPQEGWLNPGLRELWQYRELLYYLTWRDVKVRYKQTVLGVSWAIIQPLMTMVIFSLIFGQLAQIPSDGIPYPVFSYAALVPWTFFSASLTKASTSLLSNTDMIKKVYFPRLSLPIAGVLGGLVDFVLAFAVLLLMIVYFLLTPAVSLLDVASGSLPYTLPQGASLGFSMTFFTLPFFVLLALISALGLGLWLSAMNAQFRDVRYATPFIVQMLLWASPVAYPASLLDEPLRTLYALNPMVSVIEGFRWALLGSGTLTWSMVALSTLTGAGLLVSGVFYFRRLEKTFADVI
jgi:lipopolysaccharide transport system permease protein